jgi:hypothetical protein
MYAHMRGLPHSFATNSHTASSRRSRTEAANNKTDHVIYRAAV